MLKSSPIIDIYFAGPRTPTEEMENATKKARESHDGFGSLPQDLPLSQQEYLTENDDADTKAKSFICKAWVTLVEYMDPMPIFDHAKELFKRQKIRDMKVKYHIMNVEMFVASTIKAYLSKFVLSV